MDFEWLVIDVLVIVITYICDTLPHFACFALMRAHRFSRMVVCFNFYETIKNMGYCPADLSLFIFVFFIDYNPWKLPHLL